MFKTNIFGYKKNDVDKFVKESIESVIKLRKDIYFLEQECNKVENDNKILLKQIEEYKNKLKEYSYVNERLVKLKDEQKRKNDA